LLTPEERLEEIMKVLDELEELSSTMPVVVEGLKDIEALRRLGIERNVMTLGRGATLFTFCEEVSRSTKEVVVLTDWDRKGGRLARTLKEGFEANDVRVIDHIRTKLVILSKKEIKDIESLPTFVTRLRSLAALAEGR
jgi:5S rRNA maturation endonuclease (ribonuclease M5)